ncbi:MAG TPA: inositol monophosphatase family protein [Jatrophihabitantaceae bacterium]
MDDLALAASLVTDAGRLAARMLADGVGVSRKTSVTDVVSVADHAAEELIATRLRELRPEDGVVGEEGTSFSGARTWYVDPVDGTYNFVSGLAEWCAAVALTASDGPLLGAVYQPAVDELWLGGHAHPTSCNGAAVPAMRDRPLAEVSIASYLHPTTLPDDSRREPMLRAMRGAATVRMLGSGSVELAAVAAGRLGGWVQIGSLPWDWLPGAALVRAAGGAAETLDAHGHRWHLAGSRRVVDDLAALISG